MTDELERRLSARRRPRRSTSRPCERARAPRRRRGRPGRGVRRRRLAARPPHGDRHRPRASSGSPRARGGRRAAGRGGARVSPRVLASPERTDPVRRQLDEYFAGGRRRFDVPIDWRLVRGFAGDVLARHGAHPVRPVSSYREVAAAAGSPNAYRAAGNALGSNPVPIVVPCHRVLHAGGGLGGYRRARAEAVPPALEGVLAPEERSGSVRR